MSRMSSKWLARGILIGSLFLTLIAGFSIAGLFVPVSSQTGRVPKPGTLEDPHIKFVGRWDTSNPAGYYSSWPGAYFETGFTGTTAKAKLAGSPVLYVSIDHSQDRRVRNLDPNGIMNLTPVPLKSGTHTLRVAIANDKDILHFQGLILDPGATTVDPHLSSTLIEFIGDSITVGATDSNFALSDYAWLTAERLGVEHTQIAESGMCLVDKVRCYTPDATGMSQQYFKSQPTYFPDARAWDFSRYQATAVVINLGTNDRKHHINPTLFQSTYVTFLQNIQAKYPHALIFTLEPFNGAEAGPIQAAVQTVTAAGDHCVFYINTTGWLQSGSNDFSGNGLHPSDKGQIKAADHLTPILAAALKHRVDRACE